MFLVDDLLMSPAKGVLWVFKEIHDAAQQEMAGEGEAITAALSELYRNWKAGSSPRRSSTPRKRCSWIAWTACRPKRSPRRRR